MTGANESFSCNPPLVDESVAERGRRDRRDGRDLRDWRFLAPGNLELDWRNILSPGLKRVCMWFAASCFLLFFGILAVEAFFFS